ncbi:MAG: tetratricopeptide repeat protein, partial [Xanthomonadales bacterium]|nr:tetratricopeptide repeat protein [Xanthomonadales bacterium]
FQGLLARFPDSRKAPDALLKVGYCQYELGDSRSAARTLNDVVSRYPDTPVARLAQGRLRALRLDGR